MIRWTGTAGIEVSILNPIVGVRKPESVGIPLANIWIKIVNDNFMELPAGEVGEIAEKEIINFVRSRIAEYKAPRMVEFVDSLPQGPTGKILKRELRAKLPVRIDAVVSPWT